MKRLFCLFLLLFLIGCDDKDSVRINSDELGYDISDCLDIEEERLINSFHEQDIALIQKSPDLGFHIYTYSEMIHDLEYEVTLCFAIYGDSSEYRLAFYNKSLSLEEWPTGNVAESIQQTYNAMKEKYGTETDSYCIKDQDNICSEKITKSIGWNPGNYARREFELIYNSERDSSISNPNSEAIVLISDESIEYRSKLTRS